MGSFGVFLQQERPIAELLDWAGRFDEAGADSVWVADHLANPSGSSSLWFEMKAGLRGGSGRSSAWGRR
jgi:alkanesulfonate monooxygenase SsuD/methylene tetrahydromethanopterin reductase-like flavin-dependent oxidoreductase (luciferase family)